MENWIIETDLSHAFEKAKQEQLPVLIDFWATGCKGCKKMDDTTYQLTEVQRYINKHFVFLKVNVLDKNAIPRDSFLFSPVLWTPCFMIFTNDGSEVRKVTGYLPQDQFFDEMELGRAMAFVRKSQAPVALAILEALVATSTNSAIIQEALYWMGVSAFFIPKRNADSLAPYWDRLLNEYPGSAWAERANCLHIRF